MTSMFYDTRCGLEKYFPLTATDRQAAKSSFFSVLEETYRDGLVYLHAPLRDEFVVVDKPNDVCYRLQIGLNGALHYVRSRITAKYLREKGFYFLGNISKLELMFEVYAYVSTKVPGQFFVPYVIPTEDVGCHSEMKFYRRSKSVSKSIPDFYAIDERAIVYAVHQYAWQAPPDKPEQFGAHKLVPLNMIVVPDTRPITISEMFEKNDGIPLLSVVQGLE